MKVNITLTVKEETWRKYRVLCLERGASASSEFEKLMSKQLGSNSKEKTK